MVSISMTARSTLNWPATNGRRCRKGTGRAPRPCAPVGSGFVPRAALGIVLVVAASLAGCSRRHYFIDAGAETYTILGTATAGA